MLSRILASIFDAPSSPSSTEVGASDTQNIAPDLIGQPPELGKILLIMLALIVGLFLAIWLVKKSYQLRFRKSSAKQQIHVLESRPISPKTMLYLVEAQGKRFLMAESQMEVKRIGDIEVAVPAEED